ERTLSRGRVQERVRGKKKHLFLATDLTHGGEKRVMQEFCRLRAQGMRAKES
ncbi:hypothetical protein ATANTOWER_023620, partial [Ataeniobius toweri]|nr:hypothetical protein [Ataeniobius toweri]